jgi:hypothetical protein
VDADILVAYKYICRRISALLCAIRKKDTEAQYEAFVVDNPPTLSIIEERRRELSEPSSLPRVLESMMKLGPGLRCVSVTVSLHFANQLVLAS